MHHVASTADHILEAAKVLISRESIEEISVRRISDVAGVSASAISYHFGSREELLIEAVRVVYRRFNAERLHLLQTAIDRGAPGPAELSEVVSALVGPSVRWSLDPQSSYRAFTNLSSLMQRAADGFGKPRQRAEYIRPFIPAFHRIAPWLDEAEVAFRVHAALGIRSSAIRDHARLKALTKSAFDLDDAATLIGLLVSVISPMFHKNAYPANG